MNLQDFLMSGPQPRLSIPVLIRQVGPNDFEGIVMKTSFGEVDGRSSSKEKATVQEPKPSDVNNFDDNALKTASLEALQGSEQRTIMDVVDKLRRTGLSSVLQLPQLVVCGDQSSGKSSVLEAITEIPFPRKEKLCTRFATEIVLRRENTASITTKITPDKARPKEEQEKLGAFQKPLTDFAQLPDLIDEATKLMGLNANNGETGTLDEETAIAFRKDVLSIEITGPGRPQL